MSHYAITTNESDAVVLVAAIDAVQGYPRDGTTTHDVPRKHPTAAQWAVALDGLDLSEPWLVVALNGREPVERLPDDWFHGGYP